MGYRADLDCVFIIGWHISGAVNLDEIFSATRLYFLNRYITLRGQTILFGCGIRVIYMAINF